MEHEIIKLKEVEDWKLYHAIRKEILFDEYGRSTVYDENYPDEFLPNHHPLLLKYNDKGIGTVRLDSIGNKQGVVRLVAIAKPYQRKGHGNVLDRMTADYARNLDINVLLVNAIPSAVGFYKKTGWKEFSWDSAELVGFAADSVQMKKIL